MAFVSVMYGLISAVTWGAGDFSGGMAVKRSNPYGVVIVAHVISLFLLVALALAFREPIPSLNDWILGGLAGICGGVGLTLLYRALASGQMSVAAPISALVAAALPVLVGFFMDGLVSWLTLAGFALALVAVWLISGGSGLEFHHTAFLMPFIMVPLSLESCCQADSDSRITIIRKVKHDFPFCLNSHRNEHQIVAFSIFAIPGSQFRMSTVKC